MRTDFYVYVIFRTDGRPCYVGKGRGPRWRRTARSGRNPHLAAIWKAADGALPVVKVREGLTEDEAFETEIALIAAMGREVNGGPLVNLTDGGEGSSGLSEDALKRIREAKIGNTFGLGGKGRKGQPLDQEHRQKISSQMLGRRNGAGYQLTPEQKARQGAALRGKKRTPEQIARITAANRLRMGLPQ